MRWLRRIAIVTVVLLAYPVWIGVAVWQQSHRDEIRYSDAIVVLGAAQYQGRPSPVYKARLDHAAYLYREGVAEKVYVTGGKREGDRFTEAETGFIYLDANGVDREDLFMEQRGGSSLASLRNVRDLTRDHEIDTLVLVSDPLHSERIERIATDLGFEDVHTSPASYTQLERSRATKARELAREVGAILLYELFNR
ncbi:MAG: YdcF family protein [Actinomycetota bacterium]